MWRTFRHLLTPATLVGPFTGFIAGLFVNVISDRLPDFAWLWLGLGLAALVMLSQWITLRWPPDWDASMEAPIRLDDPAHPENSAKRGLIVYVSLYSKKGVTKADIEQALSERDHSRLDLRGSSLGTIITAVHFHEKTLEHLWMISTTSYNPEHPGSDRMLGLLRSYLRQDLDLPTERCTIHDGPEYRIAINDDSQILHSSHNIVRNIYAEARRLGLKPADVLVDCTGGTKAMTFGAVLASLGPMHKVQLTGCHYGEDNSCLPGSQFTMVFPFTPLPPLGGND